MIDSYTEALHKNPLETLTNLAERSLVSQMLSNRWAERSSENVDPIEQAFEIRNRKLYDSGWRKTLLLIGFISLLVVAVSLYAFHLGGGEPAKFGSFNQALIMFLAVIGIISLLSCIGKCIDQTSPDVSDTESFAQAYGKFLEWSCCEAKSLTQMSNNKLRELATDILVNAAIEVMRSTETNDRSKRLSDIFKEKYTTLESLGVARGGYRKYYSDAEKHLPMSTSSST